MPSLNKFQRAAMRDSRQHHKTTSFTAPLNLKGRGGLVTKGPNTVDVVDANLNCVAHNVSFAQGQHISAERNKSHDPAQQSAFQGFSRGPARRP